MNIALHKQTILANKKLVLIDANESIVKVGIGDPNAGPTPPGVDITIPVWVWYTIGAIVVYYLGYQLYKSATATEKVGHHMVRSYY